MLKRLKTWLRNWLFDGEPPPAERPTPPDTDDLEVVIGGQAAVYKVAGVVGLCLLCRLPGGRGEILVTAEQARDVAKFRRLWTRLRDVQIPGPTWADGTPCDDPFFGIGN